jgi:hypothetical protein
MASRFYLHVEARTELETSGNVDRSFKKDIVVDISENVDQALPGVLNAFHTELYSIFCELRGSK